VISVPGQFWVHEDPSGNFVLHHMSLYDLQPLPSLGGRSWSPNRKPIVAQNYDGRLEVFMVDSNDGRLYHLWQTTRSNIPGSWEWYMNWLPMNWTPFEKEQWPPSFHYLEKHNIFDCAYPMKKRLILVLNF
jgi:hypothetical protein